VAVKVPDTRYVRSTDGSQLAYQVTGDGPLDVVYLPGQAVPIDLMWDDPGHLQIRKRLEAFCRTIWFEPRGRGASEGDPSANVISTDDLIGILDGVRCERAAVLGASYSGPNAIHFAAIHPERVSALVLVNTFAHYVRCDEYEIGLPADMLDSFVVRVTENAATGADLDIAAPSRSTDQQFRLWWARSHRLWGRPHELGETTRTLCEWDLRSQLATIAVPTLVVHRRGDRVIRVGAGRYLAEHIPGAKYVELPGEDNVVFAGDIDGLLDEIEEFLTGRRQAPEGDVMTATILFTDIVASTEQSARMGHRKWSTVIDDHNARVRATLSRYRGREVKTTGDGFLATFDASTRAVRAACEIVEEASHIGLEVRAGIHAGEVEFRPDDVVGLPVNTAKRICDLAGPGEVLVSRTVSDLAHAVTFEDRGDHSLKGVPGTWKLFAVRG